MKAILAALAILKEIKGGHLAHERRLNWPKVGNRLEVFQSGNLGDKGFTIPVTLVSLVTLVSIGFLGLKGVIGIPWHHGQL